MELMDDASRKDYPAIHLLVKHGGNIAAGTALSVLFLTVWLWFTDYPWVLVAAFAIASPLIFLILRSYAEMVRIIADMLLPK